jgi:carotenoid 1,2-hydratase
LWRVARVARAEAGYPAAVLRTLEDAPFYARSLISTRLLGHSVTAMHESLSLDRFRADWVRLLLPFRMPRTLR